jgi:hypothetical protein
LPSLTFGWPYPFLHPWYMIFDIVCCMFTTATYANLSFMYLLLGDIVFSLCNLDFHSLAHVMFMSQ